VSVPALGALGADVFRSVRRVLRRRASWQIKGNRPDQCQGGGYGSGRDFRTWTMATVRLSPQSNVMAENERPSSSSRRTKTGTIPDAATR
jgi:hypothetical protein